MKNNDIFRKSRNTMGRNNKHAGKNIRTQSPATKAPPKKYPVGALPDIVRPNKEVNTASGRSGKPITDVNTALYDSELQSPISFEEALESVKVTETLAEGETIIYIGKGDFAVVRYEQKNNKEIMHIVRKIESEYKNESTAWRDLCSYDLSLLDIKNPGPLSELYTEAEKTLFAHFNQE